MAEHASSPIRFIMYQPPSKPGELPPPPRPASKYWLSNPAFIDGALPEPQYYHSQEELDEHHAAALAAAAGLVELQGGSARVRTPPMSRPSTPEAPQSPNAEPVMEVAPAGACALTPPVSATTEQPAVRLPEVEGHLIQATMHYVEQARGPSQRGSKVVMKPLHVTKMVNAPLSGITRAEFVCAFLGAHGLAEQYAAGPHSGPKFKLWWTGVSKGQAGTIERDCDFDVALNAILKKRGCRAVSVGFQLEDLNGFSVRTKRPFLADIDSIDQEEELMHGTMVPQVATFSSTVQLHGSIILELRRIHKCSDHVDENNQAGACYKPDGKGVQGHIRLNNRRLKSWAAAVAAGEATKYIPPNNSDFDGVVGPKPRGTLGPHSAAAPSVGDPTQALLLGLMPLFTALAGQQLVSAHTAGPSVFSLGNPPRTPAHVSQRSPLSSPLQPDDNELHQFLVALLAKKDIDLLACESQLAALDFTPDILPVVEVSQLKEVTGATDGKLIKMQLFAKEWTKRQEEKRRAHL
ncbi:hypothetical protein C8Q74DRAFT_1365587 [Fomes fomentarius]|nr:hypothetical protein C8Q74DRAFT_1365587 [Fomes fomentarius]